MADGVEQAIHIAPPADEADRAWLAELWRSEWGGETMVSRGRLYHVADLDARLAWEGTARIGAATFRLTGDGCELTSLNAQAPGRGIGTALLAAVEPSPVRPGVAASG